VTGSHIASIQTPCAASRPYVSFRQHH